MRCGCRGAGSPGRRCARTSPHARRGPRPQSNRDRRGRNPNAWRGHPSGRASALTLALRRQTHGEGLCDPGQAGGKSAPTVGDLRFGSGADQRSVCRLLLSTQTLVTASASRFSVSSELDFSSPSACPDAPRSGDDGMPGGPSPSGIRALNHVPARVPGVCRTSLFYQELFGMPLKQHSEMARVF
jgi:hypothetical protein